MSELKDWLRVVGLIMLLTSVPLLVIGQSALDCLVIAVVGIGLLRLPGE